MPSHLPCHLLIYNLVTQRLLLNHYYDVMIPSILMALTLFNCVMTNPDLSLDFKFYKVFSDH